MSELYTFIEDVWQMESELRTCTSELERRILRQNLHQFITESGWTTEQIAIGQKMMLEVNA
jgi:hypothetical protein